MLAASNARQVKNIYPRTQLRFHNILLFLAQQFLNPIECSFSHVIYDLSINSANGRQVYICVKYIAPNSGSPHGMSSAIQALFLAVGFMRWYISHQHVWKRFEKQIYQICLMRNLHSSKHHHNTIDCLIVTMSLLFFFKYLYLYLNDMSTLQSRSPVFPLTIVFHSYCSQHRDPGNEQCHGSHSRPERDVHHF